MARDLCGNGGLSLDFVGTDEPAISIQAEGTVAAQKTEARCGVCTVEFAGAGLGDHGWKTLYLGLRLRRDVTF